MKMSGNMSWMLSVISFLLVSALIIHGAWIVVDFYDGLDKDKKEESDSLPEVGDGESDDQDSSEDTPGDSTTTHNYVKNLSDALGSASVEGLFKSLSLVTAEELTRLYVKLTADIPSSDDLADMQISPEGVYNGEKFVLAGSGIELSDNFSMGKKTVKVAVKIKSSKDASIKVEYEEIEVDIKAVTLYMGYILLTSGDLTVTLCDSDGKVLIEDMEDKSPAYRRTFRGDSVFVDSKGEYYTVKWDDEEGSYVFERIGENELLSGLSCDAPMSVYENENGERIYAAYDPAKKTYKYYNAVTGEQAIKTAYSYAFGFGPSGYAFVKTTAGAYAIIDSTGKIVHQPSTKSYKYYPSGTAGGSISVRRYYALPYVSDISALGSGSIDEHGWMRIRVRTVGTSGSFKNKVLEDYETLINIKGELFELPEGYVLEGYSDGVLLLSRNGSYGYYTIDGKWIANPIYTYARPFVQGLAVVGYEGGTLGMIDTKGNIVLPFTFTDISDVSSGLVTAYSSIGGWELFKLLEKPVTETSGDGETPSPESIAR